MFQNILWFFSFLWNYFFYYCSHLLWYSSTREDTIHHSFFKTYRNYVKNPKNKVELPYKTDLTLCTWNIHRGFDIYHNYRLLDILQYLEKQNFDIICLQEVHNTKYIVESIPVNQTIFLSNALGMYHTSHKGVSILSKYPIECIETYSYSIFEVSFGNNCNISKIKIPETEDIVIYNCHLNSDIFGYEQNEFIKKNNICSQIQNYNHEKQPVLVCGDFNSASWFNSIKKLKSTLGYPNSFKIKNYKPTFPSSYPLLKLDKIYTNQRLVNENIQFIEEYVDYSNNLSDHHPLLGKLKLKKK